MRSLELFFKSQYFASLTDIDGEYLMDMIKKGAKVQNGKRL